MARQFRHLRAQYYDEEPARATALRGYHLREQEIAGLIGTETSHPPRFSIPSHSHDLLSFYLVLEGALTEFGGGSESAHGACSVVLTPAGHIHRNTFHEVGGRCFLVELSPPWTERLDGADMALGSPLVAGTGELALLGLRLYQEFRNTDTASGLAAEGLVLEILAGFARQAEHGRDVTMPAWLLRARDFLHDRFADRLSLADIAGEVGIHPVHLARTFRKRFRLTPGEYQRKLRVDYATRQLATTRRALSEIALSAGFADQAHFCRLFKDATGWSPARFRATFSLG